MSPALVKMTGLLLVSHVWSERIRPLNHLMILNSHKDIDTRCGQWGVILLLGLILLARSLGEVLILLVFLLLSLQCLCIISLIVFSFRRNLFKLFTVGIDGFICCKLRLYPVYEIRIRANIFSHQ